MKIGEYTIEGGGICPEQYDVFDSKMQEVGYLRMRHGVFSSYITTIVPDWVRVFRSDEPEGGGCFRDDEREKFLALGVEAIDEWIKRRHR